MNWIFVTNSYRQDIHIKDYVIGGTQSFLLTVVLAFLFYNNLLFGIVLLPLGLCYFRAWIGQKCNKKEAEFLIQFRESMRLLISALKIGYSVENAVRETSKELTAMYEEKSRICVEFSQMERELAMNFSMEQVFLGFSQRVQQEDVDNFVTVFSASKRAGGDSIAILKESVRMIGDKIETEGEIQILIAARKLEFQVMSVIPLGMVVYMRFAFPEFFTVLYGNIAGTILMTGCLGVYGFAYWLGRKITEIKC